jgi:putative acyl-CoA dehydrogenase
MNEAKPYKTHDVLNQAPNLANYNTYLSNRILGEAVKRAGADWAHERLERFGELMGRPDIIDLGFQANANPPVLHTHNNLGERVDRIDFHPSFHGLMGISVAAQLHSLPWTEALTTINQNLHLVRACQFMLAAQNEAGHCCPISMTYAVVPALAAAPELAKQWLPLITSASYDQSFRPYFEKKGLLVGMAMTEKQGGSDVRANTTRAVPMGSRRDAGEPYLLTGHKWFCSHPMSDAFLMLAQTDKGLSCFLVPRFKPDGLQNSIYIQRLKNKLGNRSNASSEIELSDTMGFLVGEEGRGVPTIIEMVNHTRLDCMISACAQMRQAMVIAINHVNHRNAFGKKLGQHPLMQNVIADIALEAEAATQLTIRVATAYDQLHIDPAQGAFRRIATAIGKYFTTRRTPPVVAEALECLGGNGYVEESGMPRLLKESPLNSIWEGSGNVICLDVLRAMSKEPESLTAYINEIQTTKGRDLRLDLYVNALEADISFLKSSPENSSLMESQARLLVERLAIALCASLMLRFSPDYVAEAYLASRVSAGGHGYALGTLAAGTDFGRIIARAFV